MAGACAGDSAQHDFRKQMSSTWRAVWGRMLETHAPDCPYCLNVNGDFIKGPGLPKNVEIASFGRSPSCRSSSGLGSNVSMALGPPSMKSQITDFAFAG